MQPASSGRLGSGSACCPGPLKAPSPPPAVEHFRAMSPSPRQAFPVPAEIQVSPDGLIMAAPKGSPEGRGLDLPRRQATGGPGPCREMDDGRKCSGWNWADPAKGPEYLPAFHNSSPEGMMPKAFPVIDPEAPVSDIMSQSPSITTPLKTPD